MPVPFEHIPQLNDMQLIIYRIHSNSVQRIIEHRLNELSYYELIYFDLRSIKIHIALD